MNFISTISFYFILLFSFCSINAIGQKFNAIPTQHLELYQLLGHEDNYRIDTVEAFEISNFITYKEYKNYLNSIKSDESDSSKQYYQSQLPDTNITIEKDVYQEYITSNAYNKYPVLGISWEDAMNYCAWKTLQDNKKGKIEFVYRLPKESEWLAALYYFKLKNIKHDFDQKYTDWLLNTFDESYFDFAHDLNPSYFYDAKDEDPLIFNRKKIIGDSYLYSLFSINYHYISSVNYHLSYKNDYYLSKIYGYSYIGYQHIAFRIVKTKVDETILEYWGIDK